VKENIKKENIVEAIKIGVSFVHSAPWNGKIRCYDHKMGYGKYIDLTKEEYDIYQKVSNLTINEKIERLNKIL